MLSELQLLCNIDVNVDNIWTFLLLVVNKQYNEYSECWYGVEVLTTGTI